MPTVMTHAVVPLAMALAIGPHRLPPRVIVAGMALAMLPDADVIGFKFGVEYADQWGHRGASHSLFVAMGTAIAVTLALRPAQVILAFFFLWFAMASHGLLDMLTNGGLGAALFWPIDHVRLHAPITPIAVSPIGIRDFFTARGVTVMLSELKWVWLPCLLLCSLAIAVRSLTRKARQNMNESEPA